MIDLIVVKYLHFLGIFLVVGALFAEVVLVKKSLSPATLKLLSKIDGVYGLGSILAVGAGLTLWFGIGKPQDFYTGNWLFLLKVGLFTAVGLLSIWPTVFFIKHRKAEGEELVEVPRGIRISVLIEVLILVLIPVLAVMMANGIGGF